MAEISLPLICHRSLTYLSLPLTDVNVLLHVYAVHVWPETAVRSKVSRPNVYRLVHANANGNEITPPSNRMNGHVRTASESRRISEAEAYELRGLISDESEDVLDVNGNRRDEENVPLVGRGGVDSDAIEIKDVEDQR